MAIKTQKCVNYVIKAKIERLYHQQFNIGQYQKTKDLKYMYKIKNCTLLCAQFDNRGCLITKLLIQNLYFPNEWKLNIKVQEIFYEYLYKS